MKLTTADIAALVAEARPALKDLRLRSIWREGEEGYGLYFSERPGEDIPQRRAFQIELELHPEGAAFAVAPSRPPEKAELKERQRDSHPVLTRLRKILNEARLIDIGAVEGERIVVLRFDARQEDGLEEVAEPKLAIELTGKRTNLVLMDAQDRILTVHRHGRGLGGRDLVAGVPYEFPAPRPNSGESERWTDSLEMAEGPLPRNFALAAILQAAREERGASGRLTELRRAARKGLKRLEDRLKKLERELESVKAADSLQRDAELLSMHSEKIPRGAKEALLEDPYLDPPAQRRIALDPSQPVRDQVEALFKRVKKLRRGQPSIEQRCGETEADRDAVKALLLELEALEGEDEERLNKIERRLQTYGCAPEAVKERAPKPKVQENTGPRKFISSDGLTVLVGRSNSENDELSLRIARGHDIFLHVRGSPGSHVVIRKPRDKSVPLETLLDAATLAIHYSKMRGSRHAEVSYTPCQNVRKPKGAKPGLVQISNEKVLRPGDDGTRLQRLLASSSEDEAETRSGARSC